MRTIFGNVSGYKVVTLDYTGIEARVAAAIANDPALIAALREGDIHSYIGSQILGVPPEEITKEQRQLAKAATFTLIFAGSPLAVKRSAKSYGVRISDNEAEFISTSFFNKFTKLRSLRNKAREISRRNYFTVELPTGLRRQLVSRYLLKSEDMDDPLSPQRILNTRVQGTAAAGLKFALIAMRNTPFMDGALSDIVCAVVHDEVVGLVPDSHAEEAAEKMKRAMVLGMELAIRPAEVPIAINTVIDDTWGK
jgi:DNA polymerase-1